MARASRIWVEGRHDAELVEHVWGDDLRELGIVVEPMHGADDLVAAVAAFRPGPRRRLAVLLDHLVAGSKETRLAAAVDHPAVLVTGHPYVDVWAGELRRVHRGLHTDRARAMAHAAFGLINSTPHSALVPEPQMRDIVPSASMRRTMWLFQSRT